MSRRNKTLERYLTENSQAIARRNENVAENNSGSGPQVANVGTIQAQTSETVRPTASTPKLDLEAIRARAEAATPGPWTLDPLSPGPSRLNRLGYVRGTDRIAIANIMRPQGRSQAAAEANARLIAAAPTDVHALCAEVERLREALRLTLETHDQGHSPCACVEVRAALGEP